MPKFKSSLATAPTTWYALVHNLHIIGLVVEKEYQTYIWTNIKNGVLQYSWPP
jgi:hypothetical protein